MADFKTLQPGDKVCLKIIESGQISYEGPDEVVAVRDGKLFLKEHDRHSFAGLRRAGMEWSDRLQTWKFSNDLSTYSVAICPVTDETMYRKTKMTSLLSGELYENRQARALLAFIKEARSALPPDPPAPKRRHRVSRHASPLLAH